MGTIEEKDFYEICGYLNDRCLEFERNKDTDFEFDFALSNGHNIHASGVYTNIGYIEKQTGTFIDKVTKIFLYDLQYEGDTFTGKIISRVTKNVNRNLYTC